MQQHYTYLLVSYSLYEQYYFSILYFFCYWSFWTIRMYINRINSFHHGKYYILCFKMKPYSINLNIMPYFWIHILILAIIIEKLYRSCYQVVLILISALNSTKKTHYKCKILSKCSWKVFGNWMVITKRHLNRHLCRTFCCRGERNFVSVVLSKSKS